MNVSRNDPCPCGSGQKFKRCCGKASGSPPARACAPSAPSPIEFERLAALFHAGRFAELEAQASLLLKQFPESGLSWKLLCAGLQMQGKEALHALQQAAKWLPDDAEAQNNLGLALQDAGQPEGAVVCYRRALNLHPNDPEVLNNLGTALQDLGKFDEAVDSYKQALTFKPDYVAVYDNLGIAFQKLRRLEDAVKCYRQALEIDPNYVEAYCNLGVALVGLGQRDDAISCYRRAMEIKPGCVNACRSLLLTWLYRPDATEEERFVAMTGFAEKMSAGLHEIKRSFSNRRDPHRKLRIGYVSSDFRYHPVGRNMMPVIKYLDRSKFDVYLYGDVQTPDSMTEWYKNMSVWRSIAGIDDQNAAELIRCDEIDILVLLAGRFDGNRPLIAACRAAPVQVSFHDPITSGLRAMDYLLTDYGLSPRGANERFTERLFHLPTFYIHPPAINVPGADFPPSREKGFVTFGSFNNPSKVNEKVVALWARVLQAVPASRLVIKYQDIFKNERLQRHFHNLFSARGIEEDRYDLLSASDSGSQHMARYGSIDIALDTFPFTGSTTTFEALWMGVPVVTLLGDHMVARWSGAMLKKLRLDELIAKNEADYVAIAQGLAQDPARLEVLRAGLRERVAQSPLCDEKRRAQQIERAFRWMWAKWCAEQAAPV